MFCGNCGHELPDGAKFCGECGAVVSDAEVPRRAEPPEPERSGPISAQEQEETEYFGETYTPEPDIPYKEPVPPAPPRKPISKKVWIAIGSGIAVIVVAVVGTVLLTSILQKNKDKKNAELYEKYAENLGSANQEAAEKIMASLDDADVAETEESTAESAAKEESDLKKEKGEKSESEGNPTPKPTATPTATPAEHEYIYVIKDCTWSEAQAECASMGGHLVHFDTDGEVEKVIEDFTAQGYADNSKFWVGGTRDTASGSMEYKWMNEDGSYKDGSINSDSHWMENEPSFEDTTLGVQEDKMILYKLRNTTGQWVFNDSPDNIIEYIPKYAGSVGFICEIEG